MSRRILIVDDEEDLCCIARLSLEEFSRWIVITMTSGMEGLQIAQTRELDAILLDIVMPGTNGFQVCQELQANPKTQHIPVVVITAEARPHERQSIEALNVAGIIYKPFNVMTLGQQVAKILGWREDH